MVSRQVTLADKPVDVLGRFLTPPLVTIVTDGGAPVLNTDDYVNATVAISRTATPYSGVTQIRGRGNSTWEMPKKPYRLKLATAASLLGMPAERDWVLLANFYDPTRVRTAVAFEMGHRASGLDWTPRMQYVEVVFNGEYLGLYQFGEHVEVSAARVGITKASGTTGLALTGGYALEIDHRGVVDWGEPGFVTPHDGIAIAFDDPDGSTPEQAAYIEAWFANFETILYSPEWLNPKTGYARLIDRDSFIDWYLIQELCSNTDSDFYSSCKLYKERDTADGPGRLFLGPIWDFDLSMGISWDAGDDPSPWGRDPVGYFTRTSNAILGNKGATWIVRMLDDPEFAEMTWNRWQILVARLTTGSDPIAAFLDRQVLQTQEAFIRDSERWDVSATPTTEADLIKSWLTARIAWLTSVLEP